MSKSRNSSIELLRIISMIMIIFHHLSFHGFYADDATPVISDLWATFLFIGGKMGVNIFVMISGYFLINSDKLNPQKIFKFIFQLEFYSLSIYLLYSIFTKAPISLGILFNSAIPITRTQWWFATAYFVMYLLHPILNRMLKSLSKKTYQIFLAVSFMFLCLFGTLLNADYQTDSLSWFLFLYSTSAYIRLFGFKSIIPQKLLLPLSGTLYVITFAFYALLKEMSGKISFFAPYVKTYGEENKLLIFLTSLCIFVSFLYIKINSRFINTVAASTFGVYLIHDSEILRPVIWNDIFKINLFSEKAYFIPYTILTVMVIFAVCALIEFVRIKVLEKPLTVLFDKIYNRVSEPISRPFKKILSFIFE